MQWIILIAFVVIAIMIFLQDFFSRSVHLILFVLLAVLGAIMRLQHVTAKEFVVSSCINAVMLALQLAIVAGVMRKKQMMGAGDVLFMAVCCLLFEPFSFLFFLIISFLATLALHLVFIRNSLYIKNGNTVALAGWQSLVLIIFTIIKFIE